MEHNIQSSVSIIANAHLPDSWMLPKKANYEGCQDLSRVSWSQSCTDSPHTANVMRFLPETGKPHSAFRCPSPTLPLWRFCSMAGKGLCSKRVEDVRMNRIDKLRAGRKRRAGRRPFVFKSSPLAEGQGAGRLTQFYANAYAHPSSPIDSPSFLKCETTDRMALHQTTFYSRRNTVRLGRFSEPSISTSKQWLNDSQLDEPTALPSFNHTPSAYPSWSNQPQISRLRDYKPSKPQSPIVQTKTDYQSWEISLPKCSFPKMGVFSN